MAAVKFTSRNHVWKSNMLSWVFTVESSIVATIIHYVLIIEVIFIIVIIIIIKLVI